MAKRKTIINLSDAVELFDAKKAKSNSVNYNSRNTEIITVGKSNATSSKLELDLHDLPYAGLAAAARRFNYGRKRHGRFNWKLADALFAEERLKHLVNHLMLFCEERRQEDLDAVLCNAMMIAWYKEAGILSNNPTVDFLLDGKETK